MVTKYNTHKDEANSELTFDFTMRKWILRVKAGGDKCKCSVSDLKSTHDGCSEKDAS